MYTTCSELVVFVYWTGKLMNNFLSYCGLVDARIRASNKNLPVHISFQSLWVQIFKKILSGSYKTKLPA